MENKMMKKIGLSSIAVAALLSLAGCGGGSNPPAQAGTGYYLDNAVQGVRYSCGGSSGITDKDGRFTFEEDKGCTFSIAGITLREVPADELIDGKKIIEDDLRVAQLLQSIDADGNLDNGIQITDEVLKALTQALEDLGAEDKLPEDLTGVVASVGHDVEGVSGDLRTDGEVREHLNHTKADTTKDLLAGKTFYLVDRDTSFMLDKMIFNSDASSVAMSGIDGQHKGTTFSLGMTIDGDKIIFNDTPNIYRKIIDIKKKYLVIEAYEDEKVHGKYARLYHNQSDAKSYFDSLSKGSAGGGSAPGETPGTDAQSGGSAGGGSAAGNGGSDTGHIGETKLEDLIVGKTLYQHCKERSMKDDEEQVEERIDTIVFQKNGKATTHEGTFSYRIEGETIHVGDKGSLKLHVAESKYIQFTEPNGEYVTFYYTRQDAQNAAPKECGDKGDTHEGDTKK